MVWSATSGVRDGLIEFRVESFVVSEVLVLKMAGAMLGFIPGVITAAISVSLTSRLAHACQMWRTTVIDGVRPSFGSM